MKVRDVYIWTTLWLEKDIPPKSGSIKEYKRDKINIYRLS